MSAQISIQEAAEVLRQAIRGEVQVKLERPSRTWDRVYAGDVGFWIGEWLFVFFNDCDDLDYTDSVRAPDGRESEYDDWDDPEWFVCPLCELTESEHDELKKLLKAAK